MTDNKNYDWCKDTPHGLLLHIKAQPKASKSQIAGLHGNPPRLKIRIAALPVDGKANKELLNFLCRILEIPISNLKLIRGESCSNKDVLCLGISLEKIKEVVKKISVK